MVLLVRRLGVVVLAVGCQRSGELGSEEAEAKVEGWWWWSLFVERVGFLSLDFSFLVSGKGVAGTKGRGWKGVRGFLGRDFGRGVVDECVCFF